MRKKSSFEIIHLGAERTVTGSRHLLRHAGLNILIDCGLAQGDDFVLPIEKWPVPPSQIHFVFLTHAHIDHVGALPELIRRGFAGEIICTHATKALLEPMLEDAMSFAHYADGEKERLLSQLDELSWGFEYLEPFDLQKGLRFTLGRAGHILGSCWARLEAADGQSVVFSGDLGPQDTPILPDPDIPDPCDLLVMESTYGDRFHGDRKKRVERLGRIVEKALSDGGKILVPAFSLGRTQELIFELDRLYSDDSFSALSEKSPVPVFVDSPLGLEITRIYSRMSQFWDKEAKDLLERGDHPIDFKFLYAVESHSDHMRLLDLQGPAVVIAGSGMCSGGRIVDHLKSGLERPENDVLFVGYQAEGTLGRSILKYAKRKDGYVIVDGERLSVKAKVHELSGYSAHADQKDLLAWAKAAKPGRVKLVHGEPHAQKALKTGLTGLTG